MKKKILIADSCAGGLSVLRNFLDWAGDYDLIYFADGEKNPFGKRSEKELMDIVESWIIRFKEEGLVALVVACNTASIAINEKIKEFEKKYNIKLITMLSGTEEILKENSRQIKNKNFILFGTSFTIASNLYSQKIKEFNPKNLFLLDGTFTERMVARGKLNSKKFQGFSNDEINKYKEKEINNFFLGCTCFEFIDDQIKEIYGSKINLINPSKKISTLVKKRLKVNKNKDLDISKVKVYTTGNIHVWKRNINVLSKLLFGKELEVNKLDLIR